MGEVWAGVRLSDNGSVAIKVLLSHSVDANEVIARFRREAQVLARVRSKYVAQVIDFLAEAEGFVLVMDLIPGDSLHALLSYDQKLAIETTLDIVSDVLRGLRDLHNANIVHRDLKPGNIVLRPRPGLRPRATLIDFGVSRIMSDPDEEEVTAITRGDRVLGTLEYMAPEQILGSRSVTGTADLYAVGAMMYRAMAGHHVFGDLQEGHLAVAKLNQDAPPLDTDRTDEVAERTKVLLSRLLSRRLRDRFKTAEEALEEVDAIRALIPNRRPDEQSLSIDEERTLDKPLNVAVSRTEASRSGPQIEIVDVRAATPIEDEPVEEAEPSAPPADSPPPQAPQPDTPMTATFPSARRAPQGGSLRTLGVAAVLFLFGSVGGGLFGVSYARGGLAYQVIHSVVTASAAAPQPVPAPPATSEQPAPPEPDVIEPEVIDAGVEADSTMANEPGDAAIDVGTAEVPSARPEQSGSPEVSPPKRPPPRPPKGPAPSKDKPPKEPKQTPPATTNAGPPKPSSAFIPEEP